MSSILTKLLNTIISHPELTSYADDGWIAGHIDREYFEIRKGCDGFEVSLILSAGVKPTFDLRGEEKEEFEELFNLAKKQSHEYNYNKFLKELNSYEDSSNTVNNN